MEVSGYLIKFEYRRPKTGGYQECNNNHKQHVIMTVVNSCNLFSLVVVQRRVRRWSRETTFLVSPHHERWNLGQNQGG
jgi:hypothetical protein